MNRTELLNWICDHCQHFEALPMEYEDVDGTVYDFDEYWEFLTEKDKCAIMDLYGDKIIKA